MKDQFKNLIKYYRNSVADGERMDIPTKDCKNGIFFGNINDLKNEDLKKTYKQIYKTTKKSNDQEKHAENEKMPIDIFLSPFYLTSKHEYASKKKNTQEVFPFWLSAQITDDGEININEEQQKVPWFIRSVLEPVTFDNNYFPVISTVDYIDECLNNFIFSFDSWNDYLESANMFFEKVTGKSFNEFELKGFEINRSTCIIKAKEIVSATGILRLYDDIIQNNINIGLQNNFASIKDKNRNEIQNHEELFWNISHVGQYNNKFSLSTSQRESLLIFESESLYSTTAINGPPGTGKTTLLQSIVANEIVKSVGNSENPPLILASSTNNQAITNILDNFGKEGGIIDRWLPNLSSLGTYMISNVDTKQKEAKDKEYQLLTRQNDVFDGHYFEQFHNANTEELKGYYIDKFQSQYIFEFDKIDEITKFLKDEIDKKKEEINEIFNKKKRILEIQNEYYSFDLLPQKDQELKDISDSINAYNNEIKQYIIIRNKLEEFITSNNFLYFFTFIPKLKSRFYTKLQLFFSDFDIKNISFDVGIDGIRKQIVEKIKYLKHRVEVLELKKEKETNIFIKVSEQKQVWNELEGDLIEKWCKYLDTLDEKTRKKIEVDFASNSGLEQINMILDVSLRYEAFISSIHYWEGKYLQYFEDKEFILNKGLASKKEQFKLMSFLTPLFISTFYSAPNFCSCFFGKTSDNWIQKPMYELFDFLIVDEAGQVSPEIGTATFALAKKSLVVGDIHQIEPVWKIPYPKVDEGNLKKHNLLDDFTFIELKEKGFLCSSGSIMKLAQNACDYFTNEHIDGLLLREHRRCVDELVQFSNDHVYDNQLIPKIGSFKGQNYGDENQIFLPPLAYIHVNGISEQKFGSRFNKLEAEAITKWIKLFGDQILHTIDKNNKKKISDLIAIVTPFAEQKREIKEQFKKYKIDKDITVGTVHSLQGAEREIVLFSPVYGKNHQGSLFFDMGFNMLNVAITRAKKHFIVIGNMSLFDISNKYKPSGALASYLFNSPTNELSSSFIFDTPNITSENRINNLEKHRRALKKCFNVAKNRIVIVSPFISVEAIIQDDLPNLIMEAVSRDVSVSVYTDKYLDKQQGELKDNTVKGRKVLTDSGAKVEILKGIHNKAIAVDDNLLIEGSFNWLSAVRDENSKYHRHEVSQIIQGKEAKIQIAQLIEELQVFSS